MSMLNLSPHVEGGYFCETYRSNEEIPSSNLPGRYNGERCFGTAIYYMLTADSFSAMHKLRTDEVFHFYLGDPVEMLILNPDGTGRVLLLGPDILNGMQPQVVVPRDTWQGLRLLSGGNYALLGTTVAPGFEFADFITGERDELIGQYPDFRDYITSLTRG